MTELFAPIGRHTRCKRSGKVIKCPKCDSKGRIYHLAWSTLNCQGCKERISKENWLIEVEKKVIKDEVHYVKRALRTLTAIQKREEERHDMDAHLNVEMSGLLEDAIENLEQIAYYDPTPIGGKSNDV